MCTVVVHLWIYPLHFIRTLRKGYFENKSVRLVGTEYNGINPKHCIHCIKAHGKVMAMFYNQYSQHPSCMSYLNAALLGHSMHNIYFIELLRVKQICRCGFTGNMNQVNVQMAEFYAST